MVRTKGKLVHPDDRENTYERELGKVTQRRLEVVTVGKLECMPALDSRVKYMPWENSILLVIILTES